MNKRICFNGLFSILFLFLAANSVSAAVPPVEQMIPQDLNAPAEDVSDREYFLKLRELIVNAQKTIDIGAENFSLTDTHGDPVARLIEDLIQAEKKSVKVRIFINTFSEVPEQTPLFLREDILYRMRRGGVEIHFVSPSYHLRDRLIIVDGQEILEGGIPWNKKDLEAGLGSGTLIRSAQIAEKKRVRLEFLPLWDVEQHKTKMEGGEVAVPLYLLREMKYFPSMITNDDGDAVKVYLALLRYFYRAQDVYLTVSFEELSREIPAEDYYEKGTVQFQVLKTLERLASDYGLVEITEKASDRYKLRMIFPSSNDAGIRVPLVFFQENYSKQLSSEALFAYFVILYRSQISGESPVWLGSERNVEQDFPMTKEKFRAGVEELREKNLIEVYPFKLQEGYKLSESMEYRYLINPLVSLSEKLENWARLRDQYGDDSFKKAMDFARFFGEPEDPKVITVYLDLMKQFKAEDILSFTERISELPPESTPERLTYLRTLLEHETQKNVDLVTAP